MRPNIPEVLSDRLEHEKDGKPLYERAGYTSKTSFIVDALRRRLEEVEDRHD